MTDRKPSDWWSTGQPFPYHPGDGQWEEKKDSWDSTGQPGSQGTPDGAWEGDPGT